MPEQVLQLGEAFKKGLRSDVKETRGVDSLVTCNYLRPRGSGLEELSIASSPVSSGELTANSITVGTTGPQYFRGNEKSYVLTSTKLYEYDEDTDTLTQVTLYAYDSQGDFSTIVVGQLWQGANQGDFWLFWNGACHIIIKPYTTNSTDLRAFVNDTNTINTGCMWKGRTFFGGFSQSDYYGTLPSWPSFWENNQTNLGSWDTRFDLTNKGPKENWVWWSSIGGGDTLVNQGNADGLALQRDGMEGLPTDTNNTTDPLTHFYNLRNESGFMPMPWQGQVHTVKPLGRHIVVYGEGGVSALNPITDPVPTMGLIPEVHNVGVPFRGLVGGNEHIHYFIDDRGTLYMMGTDLQPKRIGYEEFLSAYTTSYDKQMLTYDPQEGDLWISNSTTGYGFNPKSGLWKEQTRYNDAGVAAEGGFLAFFTTLNSDNPTLTSKIIDFPRNSLQTLTRVDILFDQGASTANITLKVDTVDDADDSSWYEELNADSGQWAYSEPMITARAFKVTLTSSQSDVKIEDCILTFNNDGKKDLRKFF